MKILIIDDNEIVARSICRVMKGHDAQFESDPRLALARLRAGEWFDLVICDLKMPAMSGIDVLHAIGGWFARDAPMLILMTGASDVVVPGCEVLTKPFAKRDLDAAIGRLVKLDGQRRDAPTARLPVMRA